MNDIKKEDLSIAQKLVEDPSQMITGLDDMPNPPAQYTIGIGDKVIYEAQLCLIVGLRKDPDGDYRLILSSCDSGKELDCSVDPTEVTPYEESEQVDVRDLEQSVSEEDLDNEIEEEIPESERAKETEENPEIELEDSETELEDPEESVETEKDYFVLKYDFNAFEVSLESVCKTKEQANEQAEFFAKAYYSVLEDLGQMAKEKIDRCFFVLSGIKDGVLILQEYLPDLAAYCDDADYENFEPASESEDFNYENILIFPNDYIQDDLEEAEPSEEELNESENAMDDSQDDTDGNQEDLEEVAPDENILEEPQNSIVDTQEETKDVNEALMLYMYRTFQEMEGNIKVYVDDVDNNERDPELVEKMTEFLEGMEAINDLVKETAAKYVKSIEIFDPEEGKVINEPLEETEEEIEELEPAVDLDALESYIKENNLEFQKSEKEYQIYARYFSSKQAAKFEEELKKFPGAEVFKYSDIGEVHAYIGL